MESAKVSSRENEHFGNSVTYNPLPALVYALCSRLIHHASSRVKPVPSSIPYSVRFPIMPEPTLTLFGTFMCKPTDGDENSSVILNQRWQNARDWRDFSPTVPAMVADR